MDLEKKIKGIMKPDPLMVAPSESLAEVSKRMAEEGKDVVVVQENGIVLGLVPQRS